MPVIDRQFLKRSLRTADPLEARLRGARLLRAARSLFATLEARSGMLRRDEVEEMVRRFYAMRLEDWRLSRYAPTPDIDSLVAADEAYEELGGHLEQKTHELQTGFWRVADDALAAFRALFGLDLAAGTRDEILVREYLMCALRQMRADQIAIQHRNNYEGDVIDPLFRRPLPGLAEVRLKAGVLLASAKPAETRPAVADPAPVPAPVDGPIPGGGGAVAQAIFGRALEIAAAEGRNMRMPADPAVRAHLVPGIAAGELSADAVLTIPEAFEKFLGKKTKAERGNKTVNDYKQSLAVFVEIIGLKPIGLYRPWGVQEFVDVLQHVPARHRVKLDADGPVRVAADMNQAKPEKDRLACMSRGTINHKYLSNVSSFFAWAAPHGMVAKNLAQGQQVEGPKGAPRKSRRPFTDKELQRIFDAPVFTGCKSAKQFNRKGDSQLRTHQFWAPLLALFSGCRLNELGQLQRSDLFPYGAQER